MRYLCLVCNFADHMIDTWKKEHTYPTQCTLIFLSFNMSYCILHPAIWHTNLGCQ